MDKIFAPDYDRDDQGRVIFPRDIDLRNLLFPSQDQTEHVAKANMRMVKALVEFVSEPGEITCDPFAGTGTILVAITIGRKVICIELEEPFQKIIWRNIKDLRHDYPNVEEMTTLIPGDCSLILPLPDFCNHLIFSPPYANVLRKKGEITDKTTLDLGYGSAALFSANPNNIANLNTFLYHQKMEQVYRKFYQSLVPGGTMTIIIKDRMLAGIRERLGDRAQRDCLRIGFELVERNQWFAVGGGFSAINRAAGLETVMEEDLITLRRPL
jgi:DNA modification methylase